MDNEILMDVINKVIENELRYDKDFITSDGWDFLENEAPKLIEKKCLDNEEDIDDITDEDIQDYLNEIIYEYEQTHANIRYYT